MNKMKMILIASAWMLIITTAWSASNTVSPISIPSTLAGSNYFTGTNKFSSKIYVPGAGSNGVLRSTEDARMTNDATTSHLPEGTRLYYTDGRVYAVMTNWPGGTNLVYLGTITNGVWNGSVIDSNYIGAHSIIGTNHTTSGDTNSHITGGLTFVNTTNLFSLFLDWWKTQSHTWGGDSNVFTNPLYNPGAGGDGFVISTNGGQLMTVSIAGGTTNVEPPIVPGTTNQVWIGNKTWEDYESLFEWRWNLYLSYTNSWGAPNYFNDSLYAVTAHIGPYYDTAIGGTFSVSPSHALVGDRTQFRVYPSIESPLGYVYMGDPNYWASIGVYYTNAWRPFRIEQQTFDDIRIPLQISADAYPLLTVTANQTNTGTIMVLSNFYNTTLGSGGIVTVTNNGQLTTNVISTNNIPGLVDQITSREPAFSKGDLGVVTGSGLSYSGTPTGRLVGADTFSYGVASGRIIPTETSTNLWDSIATEVGTQSNSWDTAYSHSQITGNPHNTSWTNLNDVPISLVTGSGTVGYVPLWSGATYLGDSAIFQDSGRIGIGTTNMSGVLHIADTDGGLYITGLRGNTNTFSLNTSGSDSESLEVYDNTSSKRLLLLSYSLGTYFYSGGSASALLSPAGNLLIGTLIDGGYKLDVNGSARIGSDTGWAFLTGGVLGTNELTTNSVPGLTNQIISLNTTITNHTNDTSNPHNVTYTQIGAEPAITKTTTNDFYSGAGTMLNLTNRINWWAGWWEDQPRDWGANATFQDRILLNQAGNNYTNGMRLNANLLSSYMGTFVSSAGANFYSQKGSAGGASYLPLNFMQIDKDGDSRTPFTIGTASTALGTFTGNIDLTGLLQVGSVSITNSLIVSNYTGFLYANNGTVSTNEITTNTITGLNDNITSREPAFSKGDFGIVSGSGLSYSGTASSRLVSFGTLNIGVASGRIIPSDTSTSYWDTAYSHSQTTGNPHNSSWTNLNNIPSSIVTGPGTANYISLWNNTTNLGDSAMFQSSGKIGIGTTNMSGVLHIADTDGGFYMTGLRGNTNTYSLNTSGTDSESFEIYDNTKSRRLFLLSDTYGTYLYSSGTGAVRLNPSGDFGIGTLDPQYKLDVNGTARIGTLTGWAFLNGGVLGTNEITTNSIPGLTDQMQSRAATNSTWPIEAITNRATLSAGSGLVGYNFDLSTNQSWAVDFSESTGVSDSAVRADDPRLSDARTPVSHSHPGTDITSIVTNATYATTATNVINVPSHSLDVHSNVYLSGAQANDVLKFDGANWQDGRVDWSELTGAPSIPDTTGMIKGIGTVYRFPKFSDTNILEDSGLEELGSQIMTKAGYDVAIKGAYGPGLLQLSRWNAGPTGTMDMLGKVSFLGYSAMGYAELAYIGATQIAAWTGGTGTDARSRLDFYVHNASGPVGVASFLDDVGLVVYQGSVMAPDYRDHNGTSGSDGSYGGLTISDGLVTVIGSESTPSHALDDHTDVSIGTAAEFNVLGYDGSKWTNKPTGNLIAGSNITLDGVLTNRLVGSGDITITASSGGTPTSFGKMCLTRQTWTPTDQASAQGVTLNTGTTWLKIGGTTFDNVVTINQITGGEDGRILYITIANTGADGSTQQVAISMEDGATAGDRIRKTAPDDGASTINFNRMIMLIYDGEVNRWVLAGTGYGS